MILVYFCTFKSAKNIKGTDEGSDRGKKEKKFVYPSA
jgi:hypothetical protein